jgi:hypothetical protein
LGEITQHEYVDIFQQVKMKSVILSSLSYINYIAALMFSSRRIPPRICSELGDRLTYAGFVNQELKITPMSVNHGGKAGKLLW